MKKQNGGARPGAGRPKGKPNTRTSELVEQFMKEGATPIEVLLEGMRFYYGLVMKHAPEIAGREFEPENAEKFKQLIALRNTTKDYAVAAAPYVHPKLANVEAKVTSTGQESALAFLK